MISEAYGTRAIPTKRCVTESYAFVIEKGIGDVVEFAPNVYAKPIEESLAREIIMEL